MIKLSPEQLAAIRDEALRRICIEEMEKYRQEQEKNNKNLKSDV